MYPYFRTVKLLCFISVLLLTLAAPLNSQEEPHFIRTADVVYVGSPYDVVSRMLEMAQVKQGELVIDLGCGDARMVVLAAQKFGSRGIGYEIDPVMVRASRENIARNKVEGLVEVIQADIFTVDISKADVLPVYLLPEMNTRLVPQFNTLKPGSRLVFHNYDLEGYVTDKIVEMISSEDNSSHTLYLYTTPLKKK